VRRAARWGNLGSCFLRWSTDQDLDPLATVRVDIERYLRWLQDVRRYQLSTVSRRLSVVVGFYKVCVIDQILARPPADYVRRPTVPAESPTSASVICSSRP
jgi:integrase/recombinase XerD